MSKSRQRLCARSRTFERGSCLSRFEYKNLSLVSEVVEDITPLHSQRAFVVFQDFSHPADDGQAGRLQSRSPDALKQVNSGKVAISGAGF